MGEGIVQVLAKWVWYVLWLCIRVHFIDCPRLSYCPELGIFSARKLNLSCFKLALSYRVLILALS
jgi:hypothetical protein